ncbi:MAG TPA: NADH-ubiquinone oxidoreductase-F iron-sulfur binding region domain-containing protein [Candidatus Nanopelagicales bacterium]|nr:NADH-ubiquinone oxidoreductase-F iron-sulfur binding region domain-containing protein [Candidatus Nanopelagicales bacterium]
MTTDARTSRGAGTAARVLGDQVGPDLARHLATYGALPAVPRVRRGHVGPLVELVDRSGLAGRGGGWFPTGRKMHAVATAARQSRRDPVVVVNAMEGEPAASKDAVLVHRNPHLVLDGAVLAAQSVGATTVHVAAHRGSRALVDLDRALEQRSDPVEVKLVDPPARYVASEESALAHYIGDGIALPVTVPPRVFESGVRRRPTLLSNAETYAHVALIARRGADWFRAVGDRDVPGTMLVTMGGAVGSPGVLEVPTGTTIRQLLGLAGGTRGSVSAFVTGGYGGSWVSAADGVDLPFTPAGLRTVGATPGAGVLVALPTDACGLTETARVVRWMAGQSAGQCGPCRFGLAAISDDLDRLAAGRLSGAGLDGLRSRLGIIPGRGACRHPDGVARFAASALTVFADEVDRHLGHRCTSGRRTEILPVPQTTVPLPVARPGEEWR